MALPTNGLIYSGDGYPSSLMEGGRARHIYPYLDHEYGPIAESDNSQSMVYQVWSAQIISEGTQIIVWAENLEPYLLYTGTNITDVSITFDIIGRLYCAFNENGVSKLHWYDTINAQYSIKVFTEYFPNLKIALDDKYDTSGNSDILLIYVKNYRLYYRKQRDKFDIEYQLNTPRLVTRLHKVGMGLNGRFQISAHMSNESFVFNKTLLVKYLTMAELQIQNEEDYYPHLWNAMKAVFDAEVIVYETSGLTTADYTESGERLKKAVLANYAKPDFSKFTWIKDELLTLNPRSDEVSEFLSSVEAIEFPTQTNVDIWEISGVELLNKERGASYCVKGII